MSGPNSSAGVYTREIDLSQRISEATTSIGVIVGASDRGPVMQTTLVTSIQDFIATFGKPNPKTSKMHYCAIEFLRESSRLYVTRVAKDPLTAGAVLSVDDAADPSPQLDMSVFKNVGGDPEGMDDPFNTYTFDSGAAGIENVVGIFCAANPGAWNSEISIKVKPSTKRGAPTPDDPQQFLVEVYLLALSNAPIESWLVTLDYSQDGYGNQMQIEHIINNKSAYIKFLKNPSVAPGLPFLTTATCNLLGGTNGDAVTDGLVMQGWDLYTDPEQLDCNILINAGYTAVAVQQKMEEIARTRRDSIAVLDIPSDSQTVSAAVAYRRADLNIDSTYAAMYGPDLKIQDPYNDLQLFVPPSGHVAAIYARTDNNASLWFAPAGMNRGFLEVLGVAATYNQGSRDAFEDAQLNPIRIVPNKGFFVWGADTLQSQASSLSNVPVRRLMNYLEKSISKAALYSVFDPNDRFLWMTLRDICERFLSPIRNERGLYWFDVICDERNNTPATIGSGDVQLDVLLDPTIFAKRIKLNAIINRTGVTFTGSYSG